MCRWGNKKKKCLLFRKWSQTCSPLAPCVSERQSKRIALRSGWTRVSVPNPNRVSVIIKPAPEKPLSPQGPVAHFYKEPKMRVAFVKLFSLSVPLPVQSLHCRRGHTIEEHHTPPCIMMLSIQHLQLQAWLSISAPCPRLMPRGGWGWWRDIDWELWRNLRHTLSHLWSNQLNQAQLTAQPLWLPPNGPLREEDFQQEVKKSHITSYEAAFFFCFQRAH